MPNPATCYGLPDNLISNANWPAYLEMGCFLSHSPKPGIHHAPVSYTPSDYDLWGITSKTYNGLKDWGYMLLLTTLPINIARNI